MGWVVKRKIKVERGGKLVTLYGGDPVPEAENWKSKKMMERRGYIEETHDVNPPKPKKAKAPAKKKPAPAPEPVVEAPIIETKIPDEAPGEDSGEEPVEVTAPKKGSRKRKKSKKDSK